MKSDLSFPLESAGWPAFVVEAGGVLRHANAAAVEFFGPKLEGDGLMLSALWAEEGESADHFITRWERSSHSMVPIKFRGKGGVAVTFSTYVCAARAGLNGQKRFVFQLFKEQIPVIMPAPVAPLDALADARTPVMEALAHKQKLDCAMQLARTVALDFNNALTGVLGHTSLVLGRIEWDHPCRASLIEVEKSAQRAAEVTNQLAAFSRHEKETQGHAPGNLNSVLRRVVDSFHKDKAPQLTWSLQLESQLYAVKFDEGKMQQAFARIVDNSVEALSGAGCIGISSRNLDITEPTQDRTAQLQPGSYVCVEFTDDGRGIAPEVLPKIFEPFFSTKQGHRGLGLAWLYGIVTNHRGGVAVSSQPGQWTSVRVYLPASRKRVTDSGSGNTELIGNKTVLMVDDEELLLSTGQAILSAFGYRVVTASSGAKALEVLMKGETVIDLVITDLVMPQMSGRELIEQIQLLVPGLPVICTSGYMRSSDAEEHRSYLPKPFTSQELLRRVKMALETDASSAEGW